MKNLKKFEDKEVKKANSIKGGRKGGEQIVDIIPDIFIVIEL